MFPLEISSFRTKGIVNMRYLILKPHTMQVYIKIGFTNSFSYAQPFEFRVALLNRVEKNQDFLHKFEIIMQRFKHAYAVNFCNRFEITAFLLGSSNYQNINILVKVTFSGITLLLIHVPGRRKTIRKTICCFLRTQNPC